MSESSIDTLVERLRAGDDSAATELVRMYEPYLRLVVRRQLNASQRSKFDSIDIVQSIWMDVIVGFHESQWQFQTKEQLQAFLIRIARNRLIDRVRQNANANNVRRLLNEDEVAVPAGATASQEVMSGELWANLLSLCPAQHRTLLELKRQGLKISEISERTGLHPGSVRRVLYELNERYEQTLAGQLAESERSDPSNSK
jgi:RNA polymerase sigma-70 factor (ECF subfamily)